MNRCIYIYINIIYNKKVKNYCINSCFENNISSPNQEKKTSNNSGKYINIYLTNFMVSFIDQESDKNTRNKRETCELVRNIK